MSRELGIYRIEGTSILWATLQKNGVGFAIDLIYNSHLGTRPTVTTIQKPFNIRLFRYFSKNVIEAKKYFFAFKGGD